MNALEQIVVVQMQTVLTSLARTHVTAKLDSAVMEEHVLVSRPSK